MPEKFEQSSSPESTSEIKIETISAHGNEVSFSPERGGIVTSLKLNGKEVFYFNEATFADRAKNVRGGIPILFPNVSGIDSDAFPGLPAHGPARKLPWQTEEISNEEFLEVLQANAETKKMYPYDFQLKVRGKLESDGSFTLNQEATNLETDKDMPVAMGLHPYFPVPHEQKKNIKFNFDGGEQIEQQVKLWAEDDRTVSVDNPKAQDPEAVLRIEIPELGTLVLDVSAEYKKIWVWSEPGKNFVCIEPVMRDIGGLVDDPEMVKPGENLSGKFNIRLEK